jgi:GDPmannose 4,6-dehydratase
MHAMLQRPTPRDFVVGTGKSHSVAEFVSLVLAELHSRYDGRFANAKLEDFVELDPRLLRTGEIHDLRADPSLARTELKWKQEVDFPRLVKMMLEADLAASGLVSSVLGRSAS